MALAANHGHAPSAGSLQGVVLWTDRTSAGIATVVGIATCRAPKQSLLRLALPGPTGSAVEAVGGAVAQSGGVEARGVDAGDEVPQVPEPLGAWSLIPGGHLP